MTRQDFDDLVRRIEARFAGRPTALERSTGAWVVLGLAVVLSWLGLLFLLASAAFVFGAMQGPGPGVLLLGAGVLLFVYALAQAGLFLLVDVTPPGGRALRTGEAPALASMLDALRGELQCRPFDEVRVSTDFNAGVREIPRLGLFGWPRTILDIGLPLLMVLTPDELRAVLAHEFAHVSARHGRSGSRLYRLHRTWYNVFEAMQKPTSNGVGRATRWVVSRFIDWYWPRLNARALILSRAQEYQADRIAAGVSGGPALASALWRMECAGPRLSERFWPDLHEGAIRLPEPPVDPFDDLRVAFESPPSPADAARWVERGLGRSTGNDATHPAFSDRVRSLGSIPNDHRTIGYPPAVKPSAAEALIGADLGPIERELGGQWRRESMAAWRERHRRAAVDARRQSAITAKETEPLPADAVALWKTARETVESLGAAPAEPLLRAVLGRDPDHPGASVMLGHHLLSRGDTEGERLLLQVAGLADDEWMPRACAALYDYYRSNGQGDRLREMRGRLDRHEADLAAARRERSTIGPRDSFLPHGLADSQVESLATLLGSSPDCEAAWLVRKDVRCFPNRPLFVLCVRATSARWGFDRSERDQELVKRLVPRVELPGQVLVISRQGGFRKLAARIMAMLSSEIFRRDRAEAVSPPRVDT